MLICCIGQTGHFRVKKSSWSFLWEGINPNLSTKMFKQDEKSKKKNKRFRKTTKISSTDRAKIFSENKEGDVFCSQI